MDNATLRKYVAAREQVFSSEERVRAVLSEMALEAPDSFIAIVEKLFPTAALLSALEKNTHRYREAHRAGVVEIGSGWSKARMPFSDFADVYQLELAGKHVEAIKHVRACTGLALKEAKDYCDLIRDELRVELGVAR